MLGGHVQERWYHLPLHALRNRFSISECVCLKAHDVSGAPIKKECNVLRRCLLVGVGFTNHKTCGRRFSLRAGMLNKRMKERLMAVVLHFEQDVVLVHVLNRAPIAFM